jgi:hypothetical protein
MPIDQQEVEAFARSVWPHVASVSVQRVMAPRSGRPNEFEPQDGFALTAYDAAGGIVKRVTAENLDMLKGKVERQLPRTDGRK